MEINIMLIVIGITLLIIHTAVYVYHTSEINKVFTTLIYNINTYFPSERHLIKNTDALQ
jgi:TM2 domain-containing membrane protein YozV